MKSPPTFPRNHRPRSSELRISIEGPEFPDALVDDLLAGDVVFVCGAGVSAPQLPNFKDLVDGVFDFVHMEREPGEQRAYDDLRFEEVLGSLSRRLVHPSKMYQAVEEILSPPAALDLAHHEILLRLSRDLDGRVSLVTTNFDVLFERAIERLDGAAVAATESVAGQSLPPPGSEDFAGVIHLHGRLSDAGLGLNRTPLVLTSAEYGDAYMRSGWASRFLFDLARCKTLVLIGYSATDAPVRYFLNILEADRARFSDLKSVYAFDAVESEDAEADARWSTIAVHPLTYRTTAEGLPPFGALWRDLAALAELVERPLQTRRDRVRAIVSTPFAQAEPGGIAELDWLLRSQADLWDIVLGAVEDPEWFDHITKRELWPRETRDRMLPFWCSQRWESVTRLRAAARWANGLCSDFGSQIETRLRFRGPPPGLWRRAWHLFAKADAYRARIRGESGSMLAQRLGQGAARQSG